MIYVIGVGGVGSYLAPPLCLLKGKGSITLVDGDTLETKNLNRQLFDRNQVGKNKATALSEKYGCAAVPKWFGPATLLLSVNDWLMVCVDNNAARLSALSVADQSRCHVIIAANETHSSEAYYYTGKWQKTRLDPRVYYPELLQNPGEDRLAGQAGCTGEAQEQKPQLVSANVMASSLAIHLFVLWNMEVPKLDKEVIPHLPYHYRSNLTKLEDRKVGIL